MKKPDEKPTVTKLPVPAAFLPREVVFGPAEPSTFTEFDGQIVVHSSVFLPPAPPGAATILLDDRTHPDELDEPIPFKVSEP